MAATLSDFVFAVELKCKMDDVNAGVTISGQLAQLAAAIAFTENGTTAGKADRVKLNKAAAQTISSGGNVDLDMYDFANWPTTTDPLRNTITFAEVVALVIINVGPGDLIVGGNGTAAAWQAPFAADDTFKLTVRAGGFFALGAPGDPAYAVADSSNHLLRLAASGGDATYQIMALGRSA